MRLYEHRGHRPISYRAFALRLAKHFAAALVLVVFALALGMAGYVYFERLSWLDAFLNSAMLLGGMGPVTIPVTPGGKAFAGLYALFCGLVVIFVAGVMLAPVVHRIIHRFHWVEEQQQ